MLALLAALLLAQAPGTRAVAPVLSFPEPDLDDPAAYQGYRTRFWKDAAGDAVQVYLDARSGRVTALWADAANESLGFTARDAAGRPAAVGWGGTHARVGSAGRTRTFSCALDLGNRPLDLGFFLLGSMRIEREFQYGDGHPRPFSAPTFVPGELPRLIAALGRLDPAERARQLALLHARSAAELRARLTPTLTASAGAGHVGVRVQQASLDGRDTLWLDLLVPLRSASLQVAGGVVHIRPRHPGQGAVTLTLTATTTSAALRPLTRDEIFRPEFLAFHARARAARDAALAGGAAATDPRVLRFRWLDREMRGVELVSYREKLMAGLPNFATYFGRDDMLTALLMRPIWQPAMAEAVIGAVLRKLAPDGQVSHEEALGGQAIREHAGVYDSLVTAWATRRAAGDGAGAAAALARARALLADLQAVRENYRMVDDEFQLPVVVASWLGSPGVTDARVRAFLLAPTDARVRESRLARLLRELTFVTRRTAPYAARPIASNLVGFNDLGGGRWQSGSWRDSGAGYGGGRFAMDVNAIWVPAALRSLEAILATLRRLGYDVAGLAAVEPGLRGSPLEAYAREPAVLRRAISTWDGAEQHFRVALAPREAEAQVAAKLAWLPAEERSVWQPIVASYPLRDTLRFLALSLDGDGRPIPIASTDPAMRPLLGPPPATEPVRADDLRDMSLFLLPYPVGLFIEGVGPVAANDAYAPSRVWEAFRNDLYHSPRTVWGREVNVALAGLARRIEQSYAGECRLRDPAAAGYVRELRDAATRIARAVDASGLAHHELWSYRVEGGRVVPVRYGFSSDVQLWNLTDLAVQYLREGVSRCTPAGD